MGKLVPMSTPLKSGDQIEILTSIKQEPKDDWLGHLLKLVKAKQRIKRSLKKVRNKLYLVKDTPFWSENLEY